ARTQRVGWNIFPRISKWGGRPLSAEYPCRTSNPRRGWRSGQRPGGHVDDTIDRPPHVPEAHDRDGHVVRKRKRRLDFRRDRHDRQWNTETLRSPARERTPVSRPVFRPMALAAP